MTGSFSPFPKKNQSCFIIQCSVPSPFARIKNPGPFLRIKVNPDIIMRLCQEH